MRYYFTIPQNVFPCSLIVEPTNVCNLKCPLCPTGLTKHGRDRGALRLDDYKRIIDQFVDYIYMVSLYNNGEPFLNKEIFKFIEYSQKMNIGTVVNTNFNICSKEDMIKIVESGLEHLVVSIDGCTQETYSRYRVGGDYHKVLNNLKLLIDTRKQMRSSYPFIEWQFLVFKYNEHEIERAERVANDIGVDKISFVGAILEDMSERKGESLDLDLIPQNKRFQRDVSKEEKKCRWLWFSSTINQDGGVSPCCWAFYPEDDFGNVLHDDFINIWNSEKFMSARALFQGKNNNISMTICDSCVKTKKWKNRKR